MQPPGILIVAGIWLNVPDQTVKARQVHWEGERCGHTNLPNTASHCDSLTGPLATITSGFNHAFMSLSKQNNFLARNHWHNFWTTHVAAMVQTDNQCSLNTNLRMTRWRWWLWDMEGAGDWNCTVSIILSDIRAFLIYTHKGNYRIHHVCEIRMWVPMLEMRGKGTNGDDWHHSSGSRNLTYYHIVTMLGKRQQIEIYPDSDTIVWYPSFNWTLLLAI